jgi:ribosomal protein S16
MTLNTSKFNKLTIRFRRRGHYKYPVYEIVVTTRKMRARGSFLEKIGFYNPHFNERIFSIDTARLAH